MITLHTHLACLLNECPRHCLLPTDIWHCCSLFYPWWYTNVSRRGGSAPCTWAWWRKWFGGRAATEPSCEPSGQLSAAQSVAPVACRALYACYLRAQRSSSPINRQIGVQMVQGWAGYSVCSLVDRLGLLQLSSHDIDELLPLVSANVSCWEHPPWVHGGKTWLYHILLIVHCFHLTFFILSVFFIGITPHLRARGRNRSSSCNFQTLGELCGLMYDGTHCLLLLIIAYYC
jgi:hypothetical protein